MNEQKIAARRVSVLLAVQRALLGAIGPNLRGVAVGWSELDAQVLCLYDGAIRDADRDSMHDFEAQLLGDFPESVINVVLERYDRPLPLSKKTLGAWAYCRREGFADET